MRLKCVGLAKGVSQSIFFWNEGEGKEKRKVFKKLGMEDEFLVDDQVGHEIMAVYKGMFKVVHYGDSAPVQEEVKMTEAPRKKIIRRG